MNLDVVNSVLNRIKILGVVQCLLRVANSCVDLRQSHRVVCSKHRVGLFTTLVDPSVGEKSIEFRRVRSLILLLTLHMELDNFLIGKTRPHVDVLRSRAGDVLM